MDQSYCYSFRFCCDPGFNDRREIMSLQRFVREAQIVGDDTVGGKAPRRTDCLGQRTAQLGKAA